MFGFLNNTTIRASDEKGFTLALPETGNQYFYIYRDIIKRCCFSHSFYCYSKGRTWKLC